MDDFTGEEGAETVGFGLDGVDYEIDLNNANESALRAALAPFVERARRVGRGRRNGNAGGGGSRPPRSSAGGSRTAEDRERNGRVREWARGQGMTLSERGRIPNEVNEAYDKAHPDG